MDTPRLPIANIAYQRTFCQFRIVVVILLVFLSAACTSHEAKVPQPERPESFPEVAKITFTGNTHFSSSKLREAMATKQRPLFPPWKHGEPYNPPTLEADLLRLKKFYFDHGFLEATARLEKLDEDPERHTVRPVIAIDEGLPTRVTSVSVEGTVPPELPAVPVLLKDLPLRPQENINKEGFDRSKALLLTRLHDAGYGRAEIVPRTEVDPEQHTAAVTFTLVPGAQTVFGRITIEGERQVEEPAIRRQLTIHEGQRFSDKGLTTSADAIYSLGMFQAVTPRALNPEAADEPLDVEFEVIERKPHSLQLGLGYSTIEGFRTEAQWTYRNLFHKADQLSLLGRYSSFEQKAEVKLHLPYFLAERTSFTQTLFVRNQAKVGINPSGSFFGVENKAQPAFDLFSYGAESRVDHRFTETLSAAVGLNLSRNDFYNVDQAALAGFDPAIAEDNTLLIQFVEVQWNTSDSLLNPSRGLVLRGRIEHSNTALVSDVSFVKVVLEGRHYAPLWDHVILATRLKVGGIEPYGGATEVPFNVRFFAGGAGSVRGFPLNRLGPENKNGDPVGGMSLIEGSVELRFPLFGDLGGVLFMDTGNVFLSPFTYRLDELRYAVGPGIRYNTPVGPVRLDVGIIIDRRPGDQWGRIEFSIGQAF